MNQLIYNSFPRSGNVYAGYVGSSIIWSDYATVHIPQIIGTKDLDMVSIFRKPEDSMASLINKQLETQNKNYIAEQDIIKKTNNFCNLYKEYMSGAKMHHDYIYILKFDDLVNDTLKVFVDISNKFNGVLLDNYESNFKNLQFSGRTWEDIYDGHIPREKNDMRLNIERSVGSLQIVKDLNEEYEDFINQYQSYTKEK